MCWIPWASGSFNPGALATAGASAEASLLLLAAPRITGGADDGDAGWGLGELAGGWAAEACRVCITGSVDDDEAGAGEGEFAGGAAAEVDAERLCRTGSDDEGVVAAGGSGASGELGLPPAGGSEAGGALACAGGGADGEELGGAAGAAALAFALFPAFCRASIKSSLAPASWNFLARSGFTWKSTPRCWTISTTLLDGFPRSSSVTSSFVNGWSALAEEPNKPNTTKASATRTFSLRLKSDFISRYPSRKALSIRSCRPIPIESEALANVVRASGRNYGAFAQRESACTQVAGVMTANVSSPGGAATGSVGYPSSTQASYPPSKGQTSRKPFSMSSRAILALVASFGQVQYITTGRSEGISEKRASSSWGGIQMAPATLAASTW
jgi:hypothetical protein